MTERSKIFLAQMNPIGGDIDGNFNKLHSAWKRASKIDADIFVAPEMFLSGYPIDDLVLRQDFISKIDKCIDKLAKLTSNGPAIICGAPRNEDGVLRNSAVIMDKGKILGYRDKSKLPNEDEFYDNRQFMPGELPGPILLRGIKFGIPICQDIWDPEVCECLKESGAEIIISINGSPYNLDKMEKRLNTVVSRAVENEIPFIYLNMVGGQDELVFDGGSFVVDGNGKIIYQAKQFEEELFHIDLDLEVKKQPTGSVLEIREKSSELESLQSSSLLSKNESLYSALKLGLFDYVKKNNFEKVLIGLSGGIDSALTATIAVDALGSENVIGVAMPSKYNSEGSLLDAEFLAENLKIEFKTIEIEGIVENFRNTLTGVMGEELGQTTDENIQSRVRGNILMALSNQTGAMVVSTGNKSEMAVGYSTLYGDLAGGFALLKDLYKTEVYNLSNFRNTISNVIPQNTIDKEPSAELRPDQYDKDSLPEYGLLDKILHLYIEEDSSSEKIISTGIDENIVYDVLSKVDRNEYKRKQVAPGVKLTEKAFGKDRRMPITNTYIRERD